eukprot:Skav209694  [mRNA]  locus=scaffold36:81865:82164:+ [translate_table: standard]
MDRVVSYDHRRMTSTVGSRNIFGASAAVAMGCAGAKQPQPGQLGLNVQDASAQRSTIEAKIVLLGDSGVGKSSLALRFCQGRFNPYHEALRRGRLLEKM